MNVDESVTTEVAGAGVAMFLMRDTENGPTPLLMVASIVPLAATARPNGFGALTATSRPAGVISRPFGSTAPSYPAMGICRVAGRFPAGARKRIAFGPPAPP